jgi:hypothetical protein
MVTCMAGSNDGDLIISGSVDGRVLLLSVGKKKVLQTFIHSRPGVVQEGGPAPSTVPAIDEKVQLLLLFLLLLSLKGPDDDDEDFLKDLIICIYVYTHMYM